MDMVRPTFLQNLEAVFVASLVSLASVVAAGVFATLFVLTVIRLERLTLMGAYWAFTRMTMSLFVLVVASGIINGIYNAFYLKPGAPHTDFFFGEDIPDPQVGTNSSSPPPSPNRPSTPALPMAVEPTDRDRPSSPEPDACASEYEAESESSANEAEVEVAEETIETIPVAQVVRPRMVALNVAIVPSHPTQQIEH
jgi:hypothetical protein